MQDNMIQVFENKEFGEVRVVHVNGQPWWVLKDVCEAIGIRNVTDTAKRLDGDEKAEFDSIEVSSNGTKQRRKRVVISESGLYAVILRSDKPNAKDFRKWITSSVLPSIRKHGAYVTEELLCRIKEDGEYISGLIDRLTAEKAKTGALLGYVEEAAPKVRYHDIILRCPEAVQVSIIAKDYGMGAADFNKTLHRLGVQFRIGKTWLLYQKHQGCGYTITNTYMIDGKAASMHTCWTQRGRYWLYGLLKSNGILPIAEKMECGGQMSFADSGFMNGS
jgi:prophage antirepressor-like protein/phage antirepressor YoqD-like protein